MDDLQQTETQQRKNWTNRPSSQLENLEISNSCVARSASARNNIGVIFDDTLSHLELTHSLDL